MECLIDSWHKAKRLKLIRSSPCGTYRVKNLDSGVNYFILALEKLGCVTHYSCEGHFHKKNCIPQFYIAFEADSATIRFIRTLIYKTVYLKQEFKNLWVLRIDFKNPQDKIKKLQALSKKWNKKIGSITYEDV